MSPFERLLLLAIITLPGIAVAAPAMAHYLQTRSCLEQIATKIEQIGLATAPDLGQCEP